MSVVEVDPKVPFLIATTPKCVCVGGATPFQGLTHFTLDPYLIMPSVKQGSIKYHFSVFGMTRPGIEPRSPGPLANTLTIMPMSGNRQTILPGVVLIENNIWNQPIFFFINRTQVSINYWLNFPPFKYLGLLFHLMFNILYKKCKQRKLKYSQKVYLSKIIK